MLHLTVEQARGFYAEHDGKPFFDGLVEFMTSGPIVVSVLESENAVQRHRDLLGQPIRLTLWRVRCVLITLTASPKTGRTVLIPWNPLSVKSPTSLVKAKCALARVDPLGLIFR